MLELLSIKKHEQRSKEWFKQRENKLTSSDAATALGINPYQKYHTLLFKKCGYDKTPFIGNIATRHGQKYEDVAIELYCRVTGNKNYNFGLIEYDNVHSDREYSFLAGSPDGICINPNDQGSEPILLEVKCPYKRKIIMNKCPEYYYPQIQLNLFITGLETADFIEYNPPGNNSLGEILNIVRIKIDYEWLSINLDRLKCFWDEVIKYRNEGIETHPLYK